jgi:hypothetical protein
MSRWIILSVTVVALTAVTTFLVQYVPDTVEGPAHPASATVGLQPMVVIDQDLTHTFGTMSQKSKAKHSWKITNKGDGDLELWLDGKTSCSCTIASLGEGKKEVVKPGESKNIDLDWDTKTFKDEYIQTATIGTNDLRRPTFTLQVKGKVFPPVVVLPPDILTFGPISNEEPHKQMVAVFSPDRPAMKIKKVTSSRPGLIVAKIIPLTLEDRKRLQTESGYKIEVEVKPGMPLGQFHDELVVETDHPQRSEIKLAIGGSANGPITAVPDGVRLPNVKARSGGSKEITLVVRAGKKTNFTVGYKPKNVEVEIEPNTDNPALQGRYRMTVKVPPGAAPGWINDQIIIKTDHPKVSELKIPVNIFVSNSGSVAS